MPQPQNIIGIVYDFDNTLSPHAMQEDTILPYLELQSENFWKRVNDLVQQKFYQSELAWMRLLLEEDAFRKLSNADLRNMGLTLTYFPGVPQVFPEISKLLDSLNFLGDSVTIEHYVVTSGLREILEGSNIKPYMKAIFGSEFDENQNNELAFPKRAIGHTEKTQYLFRINKGYLDLHTDVNDHVEEEDRRIPFENMIYIGDGPTDVPCFAVMSEYGGRSIAVYNPENPNSFDSAMQLHKAHRVEQLSEADYRSGSQLRRTLEYMIREIGQQIIETQRIKAEAKIIPAPRHI